MKKVIAIIAIAMIQLSRESSNVYGWTDHVA